MVTSIRQTNEKFLKRIAAVFGVAVAFFVPRITFAYLSPSTISLVVASSGGLLVACAAGIMTYGILAFSWVRKHKTVVAGILIIPLLFIGYTAIGAYGEYQKLKDINTFDGSSVKRDPEWSEFIEGFAKSHFGVNASAFVQDDALSVNNVKKIVPRVSFEEAREENYTLLGTFCEPVTLEGAVHSCELAATVLNEPTNREKIESIMSEMGVGKSEPVVTFCDSGLRSSLTALVLAQYGYNVQGRAQLYNGSDNLLSQFTVLGQEKRGSAHKTLIREYEPESGSETIVFLPFRIYSLLENHEDLKVAADRGNLRVLLVVDEYFTDEGRGLDPIELPLERFYGKGEEYGEETHVELESVLDGDVRIACTTPLSCMTTRGYLEHVGKPTDILYCTSCDGDVKEI